MASFQWYAWTGNIRALENLVERVVILSRDSAPKPVAFDFGHWTGRLDRRWTTRRCGQTGTEANDAACQDEKDGDLANDPSGGNRRAGYRHPRPYDEKMLSCEICAKKKGSSIRRTSDFKAHHLA